MINILEKYKYHIFASVFLVTSLLGLFYYRQVSSQKIPEEETSAQERIFEEKLIASLYEEKLIDYRAVMENAALSYNQEDSVVLGEKDERTPSPKSISPEPDEGTYKIAIVGDSMVETMGDSLEYLQEPLREKYPNAEFAFYNYGHGAENVESAINRFDEPFSRLNRSYDSLLNLEPDILIVASYAYNPLVPYSADNHWSGLVELMTRAQEITDNLYLLVEIAPLEKEFGEGVGGVNWPADIASEHAGHIAELLQNGIGVAEAMNIPLIDVYSESKLEDSFFGEPEYIDDHDGIHPSIEGHKLIARVVAESVSLR